MTHVDNSCATAIEHTENNKQSVMCKLSLAQVLVGVCMFFLSSQIIPAESTADDLTLNLVLF